MFTAEAPATAEVQDPGSRIKACSPRQVPAVGVVPEDEETQVRTGVCTLCGMEREAEIAGGEEAWGQHARKRG